MIVKSLRLSRNMSQQELADELNVARSTVASWELGVNYPRMDKLFKLSALFNCPVSELVEGWRDG